MKTKILQITHDLQIGGLQQVVVNICRSIDRSKFDISVLCLRDKGPFVSEIEDLNIEVLHLQQNEKGTDYFSFLKVAKILKERKIEVIHTHNTQPFVDGTIAALLSGTKTIVHTDHARDFPDKVRYMVAEHLMSHFAYKVVGVSEHTTANLNKYEKISTKKLLTIPNGIDGSKFAISIDKDAKKQQLGIAGKGPIIGLCVRLAEQKGITYLLRAMPKVIECFPDIMLLIVGEGALKSALETEAEQLGITDNVNFLGPRLDIPDLLKLFDIYVLPSLWEGLPMVLLEAMAAKCPIIATDVGGVSKLITNNTNGVLVPSKDHLKLSEAIIELLKNEKLRHEFAMLSFRKFEEEYSASIMTKEYEKLYLREPIGESN